MQYWRLLVLNVYWFLLIAVPVSLLPTATWIVRVMITLIAALLFVVGHAKLARMNAKEQGEKMRSIVSVLSQVWPFWIGFGVFIVLLEVGFGKVADHLLAGISLIAGPLGALLLQRVLVQSRHCDA